MQPRIEVHTTSALSEQELGAVARQRSHIDYGLPAWGYQWADKTWRVIAWLGDNPVAHVGILERVVEVEGHSIRVGGISSVWTVPELRGQGLGRAVMGAAATFLRRDRCVEFGLLLCREQVQPFYEKLGWQRVQGPLVFEQPVGKVVWPLVIMVLPCQHRAWPPGPIDLCGLPW